MVDRCLTWANHIQGLKESCKKPLEILKKTLSSNFRDRQGDFTQSFYFNGSVKTRLRVPYIYGSASDSLLHELKSVRNKALRLEIDALYTSNADSLHAETNVIPLHFHREFVAAKSLLRIPLSPGSPLLSLYNQALIPDDSWPFSRMVSEAFYTIGEMQPVVIPFNFRTSPPWICPQPKICFSLGSRTKKSCLPQDLLGTFLSHIPSHPES